jgi:polysaccharide biosynthesis protein PelC
MTMQIIRCLTLVVIAALATGCSSFTRESGQTLPRNAAWGVAPLVNYAQTPQAGERAEQILISILAEEGVRPLMYPQAPRQDLLLQDDRERQIQALDWARQQRLAYVITGSVEEWQYKNGLDGEPAVGVSLQVLEPATGRVVWSSSGARAGWSRESLAGAAQKVLRELVGNLDFE